MPMLCILLLHVMDLVKVPAIAHVRHHAIVQQKALGPMAHLVAVHVQVVVLLLVHLPVSQPVKNNAIKDVAGHVTQLAVWHVRKYLIDKR